MRAALLLLVGCAHIPGTDVAIPPEWHNGGRLAACYPNEGRHKAICLYEGPTALVAWCTFDEGRRWEVCKNEDVMPSAQPGRPEHDTDESL